MIDLKTYWPAALAHLAGPYETGGTEHVVIAEINDQPHAGSVGFRKISTALVPIDLVDAVLQAPSGIGWEVRSWGPLPCVSEGATYATQFWIDGRHGSNERFETILNAWQHHDQEVMLPDSVMLMTYGLVPRYLADGFVAWDDPRRPVYDVIRAKSHVDYKKKQGCPLVSVTMRRNYLEDYCSLKKCAAVAVYYEERYSADDPTIAELLAGDEGTQFELPGRLLGLAYLDDEYHRSAPQFCRVWGVRLILRPSKRPVTDEDDPQLIWPDHAGVMTLQRASKEWLYAFVSDAVLTEYESRPEYSLHPESGGVSYGGWWGTNYTSRVGREHIRVELKKLYEGCPPHVIAHWHRFAVPRAVADHDRAAHGDRSVSVRAKELMLAYLGVTEAITELSERLGGGFRQEEIGSLTTSEVHYRGWWSPDVMKPITAVIRLSANQDEFLQRAVTLFKLLELIKPAPLRNLVLKVGVASDAIKDFGSLKLLATLCQLAVLAREHGFNLVADPAPIVAMWDGSRRLPQLEGLFALNGLRLLGAHLSGAEKETKIAAVAGVFEFDVNAAAGGWGYAIDALYDRVISDLRAVESILRSV